ncbi:hypothetical protein GGD66_007896 [Bradyrhizobium sp. CIR48]|uniref:hypothetical protein n=1 Tax=unclassified Bradyrhizobium TaxID=2631580 RepID=UPI0018253C43|nr:hypothetical protein [Bradyrhizobium sp. CIR18]MBB4429294.1 hypothetical protein [Bradyrhizobium sp. CIR48]
MAHFVLAAALAQLRELNNARTAAQEGLSLDPTFTVSRFRTMVLSRHPASLAARERTYEGMRMAGLPEG